MSKEFRDLGLSEDLVLAVSEAGYDSPTPIQDASIPGVLAGRDVMGCAQTGTGKTAAFALPIIERLSGRTFSRPPRALVLAPTRELAAQVSEFTERYAMNSGLRVTTVVGGMSMGRQKDRLKKGTDILVATPGRLLDLHGQRCLDLSRIETAVLDEADRMLDMGFIPDVRRIFRLLPRERQTLLFSATLPPEITRLAGDLLNDPVRVEVAPPSMPVDGVTQVLHPVDFQYKEALLDHLLRSETTDRVLIFTRTKRAADSLHRYLSARKHDVAVIHGDHTQSLRNRAMDDFRRGKKSILVATDLAARGLDIDGITHVFNFDMPPHLDDYIHRIGRTARAEARGKAVSLVGVEDWDAVKEIEKKTGIEIPRVMVPGFEPKVCAFLAASPSAASKKKGAFRKRRSIRRRFR